jgi:hypothetical protein
MRKFVVTTVALVLATVAAVVVSPVAYGGTPDLSGGVSPSLVVAKVNPAGHVHYKYINLKVRW